MVKVLDNISYLIILRALYLYKLLSQGWVIKKGNTKNTFELTKVNLKK
jgi:hypothetical protein